MQNPIDCQGYKNSTVFGACLGNDDSVEVELTISFTVNHGTTNDIGLYIALDGGDALNGECAITTVSEGTYNNGLVTVTNNEAGNNCPDLTADGQQTVTGYGLGRIVFPCIDSEGDGYME